MAFNQDHIKWFRDSSPYIDAHRGRTFVLCLPDRALESSNLSNIISDIALLNSLGVRLVLVYGVDHQVSQALTSEWSLQGEKKITTEEIMQVVTRTSGLIATELMSRISASNLESPGSKRDITTVTGNFLRAKPLGIIDGIDHLQSGEVRRVNSEAVHHQLDGGAVVLIPSFGYSPSGETFHLETTATASHVARALQSDKLIYMTDDEGLRDTNGKVINELDLSQRDSVELASGYDALIKCCDQACQADVDRCHIISFETDGALLEELFTRDGCGTQIVGHSYEQVRQAVIDDVPGILRLIEPLENEGVLVKRSRELLESEIEQFIVIERDGLLISCAALYPFEKSGELACVVTHPDYRNGDRGDRLLDAIDTKARSLSIEQLFVLTTQSLHWFTERGFNECSIEQLPDEKLAFYNFQRNSRVLFRPII